jgi:hypothetical protein
VQLPQAKGSIGAADVLRGLITPDPLFLGIDVGVGGIIYDVHGERVPNLYTLGSPQ